MTLGQKIAFRNRWQEQRQVPKALDQGTDSTSSQAAGKKSKNKKERRRPAAASAGGYPEGLSLLSETRQEQDTDIPMVDQDQDAESWKNWEKEKRKCM